MNHHKKFSSISPAFTLLELLFVVSFIAVLSSVLLVAVNTARAKGIESKKVQEVRTVGTALKLHQSQTASVPGNYNVSGTFQYVDNPSPGNEPACEDTNQQAYNASIQKLVDSKSLSAIPRTPDTNTYCYFDYSGPNEDGDGATFFTKLNYPIDGSTPIIGGGYIYASNTCPKGKIHTANGSCRAALILTLTTSPSGPVAVGVPVTVAWSISYVGGTKTELNGNWGDGFNLGTRCITLSAFSPTPHAYSAPGTYTVTLTARGNGTGSLCNSSDVVTSTVTITVI